MTPDDPNSRQWTVRYGLIAYGASWIFVGLATLGTYVVFGTNLGAADALWFDLAWLASLIPLRRAGQLRAADLGLRTTPAARAFALTMFVFIVLTLFDAAWQTGLGVAPAINPFTGIGTKSTALILLTGVAAVLTPVVEEIFFRGLLYRSLCSRFSVLWASLANGVMFALVHGEYALTVLPELAVAGVLLCLLYEYTGSLWPGITLSLYLDVGGFDQALTGHTGIVDLSVVILVLVLMARGLRGSGGGFPPPALSG
jgi:membrane protease YdiL (CAAX protease family)